MSRRWLASIVTLSLAGALPPVGAEAQTATALHERLLRIGALRREASDSVTVIEHARGTLPPDSIVAGALRIRLRANTTDWLNRRALSRVTAMAWSDLAGALGDGARAIADSMPLVARTHAAPNGLGIGADWLDVERCCVLQRTGRTADFALALENTLGIWVAAPLPSSVQAMAGGALLAHPLSAADWRDAAVDLATSIASVSRSCYRGSIAACKVALELVPVRDSLHEWYGADDWRELVQPVRPDSSNPSALRDWHRCVDQRLTDACERRAALRRVPVPIPAITRRRFVALALETGGPQAWDRLRDSRAPLPDALSAAAGVPIDSLVRRWQQHVVAAIPDTATPSPASALVAVAWMVVFGVAATRKRP